MLPAADAPRPPQEITGDPLPPRHPKLVQLPALWRVKAAGRPMPLRADLTPFDLRPWLGHLMLLDVIDGGRDFRFRVHGTVLVDMAGAEMTGRLASQGPGDYWARVVEEYRAAFRAAQPFRIGLAKRQAWRMSPWEKLMLPLSAEGAAVDYLLSAMYPNP